MNKQSHYPFVRPLTKKDCERGFCNFKRVGSGLMSFTEKCQTCDREVTYASNGATDSSWAEDHKLDLLQPFGKTRRDFLRYYGETQTRDIESS